MEKRIYELHLELGRSLGPVTACRSKVPYISEPQAQAAAEGYNRSPKHYIEMSAYPCVYCRLWHIGQTLTEDLLESLIAEFSVK